MTTTELTERRELAHRTNDGTDVNLFWSKVSNRVTISFSHARSATTLEFDVDGADALDAFNHPYAYAATGGGRPDRCAARGEEPASVVSDDDLSSYQSRTHVTPRTRAVIPAVGTQSAASRHQITRRADDKPARH